MANRIDGTSRIPPLSISGGGGGVTPHNHDDRYYTKSQIDGMVKQFVLESPNGSKWILGVTDAGQIITTPHSGGGEYGTEVFGGGAFGDGPYPA